MVATVLGVVSSTMSIFSFGEDLSKAADNSASYSLRIHAGFNGKPYVPPGQDEDEPWIQQKHWHFR